MSNFVINGIVIPGVTDQTFIATNISQGYPNGMYEIRLYFSTHDPDFSALIGAFNFDTGQSSGQTTFYTSVYRFDVWNNVTVDYSNSNAPIDIDLATNPQQGGFAQGDLLHFVFSVFGSPFDDVIRGQDQLPPDSNDFGVINNPGDNSLFGGAGNDILEGRGGADLINGGSGFDFASYESSPGAVTVRLADSTQTAIASGADATGDVLRSIEGLIGSRFADTLTGNSLSNILSGGIGNDTLDGKGGIDTVDYSRDHFFDNASANNHDSPDAVTVKLGLNGANGSASKFINDVHNLSVTLLAAGTDTLKNIENVIGTDGRDSITGNELDNVLDGRGGNDTLVGGLGSDTLNGNGGIDTVDYFAGELDPNFVAQIEVHLGLGGANGTGVEFKHISSSALEQVSVDTLISIENVFGTDGDDTLIGNENDNVLVGNFGRDFIDGGFGNDVLVGGPEVVAPDVSVGRFNTVSFASHDTGPASFGERDTISLGLNGADGSFVRTAFSISGPVVVEFDVLRDFEIVMGSNRDETINGNELANRLAGRGGNDNLNGGAGNDTYDFTGPSGVATGIDRIFDDSGTDRLLVSSFSGLFALQDGKDIVVTLPTGSVRVVDHFNGHQVENVVDATGKSVVLAVGNIGGDASGIIAGTNGNDTLDGRGGDDFLFGNGGNDHLLGGDGADLLDGGAGNDLLDGGADDDILIGGPGNDKLIGGSGHDVFVFAPISTDLAGPGADLRIGRVNQDTFDFTQLSSKNLGRGNDVVTDFVVGQDRIDLSAFHTNFDALHNSDENWFGHRDHNDRDGPVTLTTEGHDTVLTFAGGTVRIDGVTHLHATDFIF